MRTREVKVGSSGNTVMNADEVSRWLRIPKSTLYKLCNKGQIPCTKIGKHWRFDRSILEAWFEQKVREKIKNNQNYQIKS